VAEKESHIYIALFLCGLAKVDEFVQMLVGTHKNAQFFCHLFSPVKFFVVFNAGASIGKGPINIGTALDAAKTMP
jgi:hypothetical protein